MMKLMRFLIILSLIISVSATFPGAARADDPTPGAPVGGGISVYLPTIFTNRYYTVSGQVTGTEGEPLSGVSITSGNGETTFTDQNGVYALKVLMGETDLAAQKDGFAFSPTALELNVTSTLVGQDFSAMAACVEGLQNTSFETWDSWWITGGGADYTNINSHTGGVSMLTGILSSIDNTYNWSTVTTPLIAIPAAATSVTLRTWFYTLSTDTILQVSDAPSAGLFGETIAAYDAQYVMILDGSNNLLETLMWVQADANTWTNHVFDLTKWAGESIKIQIGTYNDGEDGVTAMFVDDVTLEICDTVLPPPPPPAICYNGLYNSGFEYVGDWKIPLTAYPANYSSTYSYAGVTSMRTGIPLDKLVNVYSYSDAWQTVTIPADATSAWLNIKLLPMSEEPEVATSLAAIERDVDPGAPMAGSTWGDSELALDAAYILVLNPYTQTIIKTIWYKENRNSTYWLDKSWDLMEFAGKTIRIQFGVYNDGYNGQSVMYVDEAYVDICTGALPPPPPPPPPPLCEERIDNNSFEVTSDWYIPPTAFSAGYSTYRAHWGVRSMRTGIKYLSQNKFSYSDFGQVVTVPWWADTASLSMYLFNSSSEPYSVALADQPNMAEFGDVILYGDIQYLLVLDLYGNWIDTLLWQRTNEQYWKYVSVDLSKYAGHTIKLQWGTYNDGWGGVTSMFVDDVSLIACP